MATAVDDESISTFMAITTASREHARRTLQACNGDLNAAVNHYMEHGPVQAVAFRDEDEDMEAGDEPEENRFVTPEVNASAEALLHRPAPFQDDGYRSRTEPGFDPVRRAAVSAHPWSAADSLDLEDIPAPLLAPPVPSMPQDIPIDFEDEPSALRRRNVLEPRVTYPQETRVIPVDWINEDPAPANPSAPRIQEIPLDADADADADDDALFDDAPQAARSHFEEPEGDPAEYAAFIGNLPLQPGPATRNRYRPTGGTDQPPADPGPGPADPSVEEEMIRSAMEASRLEAEEAAEARRAAGLPMGGGAPVEGGNVAGMEDDEIARAMALSLQTAEEERELRAAAGLRPLGINEEAHAPAPPYQPPHPTPSAAAPQAYQHPGLNADMPPREGLHPPFPPSPSFEDFPEEEEEDGPGLLRRRHFRRPAPPMEDPWVEGGRENPSALGGAEGGDDQVANGDPPAGVSLEDAEEARMIEAAMFGVPYVPRERNLRVDPGAGAEGGGRGFEYGMAGGGVGNGFPYHDYPSEFGERRAPQPPSEEVVMDRLLKEQQDDEYMQSLAADREKEVQARSAEDEKRRQGEEMELMRRQQEAEEQEAERAREEVLTLKRNRLPAEPGVEGEGVRIIQVSVRMPDGSRKSRQFRKDDTLQALFDFIDVNSDVKPGSYQLVRQFPKRVYLEDGGEKDKSLQELGLDSRQEMLILQPL